MRVTYMWGISINRAILCAQKKKSRSSSLSQDPVLKTSTNYMVSSYNTSVLWRYERSSNRTLVYGTKTTGLTTLDLCSVPYSERLRAAGTHNRWHLVAYQTIQQAEWHCGGDWYWTEGKKLALCPRISVKFSGTFTRNSCKTASIIYTISGPVWPSVKRWMDFNKIWYYRAILKFVHD